MEVYKTTFERFRSDASSEIDKITVQFKWDGPIPEKGQELENFVDKAWDALNIILQNRNERPGRWSSWVGATTFELIHEDTNRHVAKREKVQEALMMLLSMMPEDGDAAVTLNWIRNWISPTLIFPAEASPALRLSMTYAGTTHTQKILYEAFAILFEEMNI